MTAMYLDDRLVHTERGPVSVATGGVGPDMVLLHSLMTDRNVYDRVLPDFAADHTVHLVDLPGFRATAPVAGDIVEYGATINAYVLAAGMATPPVLLGNGLGAFVALGALVGDAELYGDVVLAGVGATFPDEARPAFDMMAARATTEGMAGVVDTAVLRIFSAEYLDEHPGELAERREVLLATPVAAFVAACRTLAALDLVDVVGRIPNRTLIVTGSEDTATPPAMGRGLDALLPDSRYVELAGIAHGPQLEDPERFIDVVRTFLDN